ncbi:cupin-like domain-containing protein [Gilvimarinus sp. SDUM040013]|uniref:Cupin-like domain-containing protein n=1 Tax=Gilvimarinus gilvus TaxID=3058038 RepID=A0ABU4S067_9GAMM|nr:cupin-like domain-containing protein [Gilvimarinus sp. SDUM040013]MDO3388494.1 cupin-like domain-containing protein [Gilvimarinus sp. SDUM040013]MDX6848634.1 cupin-like domain-containing protein [Gilvimarinus sp. SDUM040013]
MQEVEVLSFPEKGKAPQTLSQLAKPVVLKGFVDHWPVVEQACQSDRALMQYLSRYVADLSVTFYQVKPGVTGGRIGYLNDFSGFTFDRLGGSFQEVLTLLMQEDVPRYIGSTRIDRWLPGFRNENDVEFSSEKPLANFWIGNATDIAAHYDSPLNIACCVSGKRTFTLFPPEQVENLYIGPVDKTPSGRAISMVDFSAPDFDRYPRFRKALDHAQTVVLSPGDAIYIPPLWWHRVKSEGRVNMLVNYWWKETPDHMGIPDLALEHAILALRGLNDRDRSSWKALFDHYVFAEQNIATDAIPENLKGMLDPENEQAARLAWINFSKKLNS